MNRLRWLTLLLVIAGLLWLVSQPETTQQHNESLPPELLGQPDLYLLDADIAQFDLLGNLHYELQSKHIRHFETDGITRLEAPTLIMHSDPVAPWRSTAERGFIRQTPDPQGSMEEVVFLRESVELEQRHDNGSFTRLRTPSLYVYPDREFAQTSDDVMIDTEVGRTVGQGMRFNLASAALEVFSGDDADTRVKTIILPDQFK